MKTELDVRGLSCPLPVVKTKKALEDIEEGEIIVLIERPEGRENVKRFAESQGYEVTIEEKEGLFHIHIRKEKSVQAASPEQNGNVIFITTAFLGTGDQKLGEILMKTFLDTLLYSKPKLSKIIFLNDAVKLTTEKSDVLDSLILLEEAGVEILSCGTCLDFYHLKDKLKVGIITNMYDIVESLLSSEKVIKI